MREREREEEKKEKRKHQNERERERERERGEPSCFALLPWRHIGRSCSELTVVTARRVAMGDSCQSITQSEGTDRPMITLD